MNIAQAKDYIKESARMYLKKDEYGEEFAAVVNGVKIFSMGADYIPEDNIEFL